MTWTSEQVRVASLRTTPASGTPAVRPGLLGIGSPRVPTFGPEYAIRELSTSPHRPDVIRPERFTDPDAAVDAALDIWGRDECREVDAQNGGDYASILMTWGGEDGVESRIVADVCAVAS